MARSIAMVLFGWSHKPFCAATLITVRCPQESLIRDLGIDQHVDFLHAMTYDQNGEHHSTYQFAETALSRSASLLPPQKVTIGVPFYGRKPNGDWVTYEDLVQRHKLDPSSDFVVDQGARVGFNGIATIERKTQYAIDHGLGGVMIWESGQAG